MVRTIVITGASTGIGRAAVRAFKARNWQVIASARKPEDLAHLRDKEGVEGLPLELSDQSSVEAFAAAALERANGRIDALYNNAAYGVIGAMEDITADVLRRQFEVNVIGAHTLTRQILPSMRSHGAGRIVFCSSVLGLVSARYRGAYAASKFALEAIADSYRYETAGSGIHVSLLEPGPIHSEFLSTTLATFQLSVPAATSRHAEEYQRRMAQMQSEQPSRFKLGPEAVVTKLVHAVESPRPKARYRISPQTHVVALAKRLLPSSLLDRILIRI